MKAGYGRISDADDELGVTRQRDDINTLASLRFPNEPLRWYVDNDISASRFSKKPRPAYEQLCEDIKNGIIDGLIGYNLDRVWRQPRVLETFLDLADATSMHAVYTVEGDIDLSTDDGRLMARVLVAFAAKESDNLSRRVRRKHREIAEAGGSHGGPPPYGWHKDGTLNAPQAKVLRDITADILTGRAMTSIINQLNADGVATARGARWQQRTIKHMVTAPRIAGFRVHHGQVVAKGQWDPIVGKDDWRKVCAILDARKTTAPMRSYPLTGLLVCGVCGTGKLVAAPESRPGRGESKKRRYACRVSAGGCGRCGIRADQLEELLLGVVLDLIRGEGVDGGLPRDVGAVPAFPRAVQGFSPTSDRAPGDGRTAVPAGELNDLHELSQVTEIADRVDLSCRALDELEDDYRVHRLVDRSTYVRMRSQLTSTLETDRAELARARTQPAIATRYLHAADRLAADWPELDVGQRAAVYKTFIRQVRIGPAVPGRQFDATRVAVELHDWQG